MVSHQATKTLSNAWTGGCRQFVFQRPVRIRFFDAVDAEQVCSVIVDCAYRIHRQIGPGLFESVYHSVLVRDLTRRGLSLESQKQISFVYDEMLFERAFVADLVVEGKVVVEIKSE